MFHGKNVIKILILKLSEDIKTEKESVFVIFRFEIVVIYYRLRSGCEIVLS